MFALDCASQQRLLHLSALVRLLQSNFEFRTLRLLVCVCVARIAIGTALLFLVQIVLLSLLSSCWELRRSTRRSLELLDVSDFTRKLR